MTNRQSKSRIAAKAQKPCAMIMADGQNGGMVQDPNHAPARDPEDPAL